MSQPLEYTDFITIRSALLNRQELALLDVREEDPHAQAHPLFAANFPLGRIELEAYAKLPRRTAPIVTLDDGGGEALRAALPEAERRAGQATTTQKSKSSMLSLLLSRETTMIAISDLS